MHFAEFLNETHWEDIYPETFKEFRKKYGKIARSSAGSLKYFVQFTNYKTSDLDRIGYASPDHHDPIGNYAYTLKYVYEHPADIWYGHTARYLRVLENTATNVLWVRRLDESMAKYYLSRMGIPSDHMDIAKKHFKYKGSTAVGKSFFAAIQCDWTNPPKKGDEPQFRSQEMQTRLITRAGFDAIRDDSSTDKQAIINQREPDQMAFLSRNSFRVVETIPLHLNSDRTSLPTVSMTERHKRKLVSSVLQAMDGDQIVAVQHDNYWTRHGRMITISFPVKDDYTTTRKMGQKIHKEFKWHDHHDIEFRINSEKGKLGRKFNSDTKFKDIVKEIVKAWKNNESDPKFQPDTIQAHQQRQAVAQAEHYRKRREQEEIVAGKNEKEIVPELQQLGAKLGIVWRPVPGRSYRYYDIVVGVARSLSRRAVTNPTMARKPPDIEAYWQSIGDDFQRLKDHGMPEEEIFSYGYIPPNVGMSYYPDLARLKEILTKVNELQGGFTGVWQIARTLQDLEGR